MEPCGEEHLALPQTREHLWPNQSALHPIHTTGNFLTSTPQNMYILHFGGVGNVRFASLTHTMEEGLSASFACLWRHCKPCERPADNPISARQQSQEYYLLECLGWSQEEAGQHLASLCVPQLYHLVIARAQKLSPVIAERDVLHSLNSHDTGKKTRQKRGLHSVQHYLTGDTTCQKQS